MAERTTLTCPMCNSHEPDDYTVVGYGSQPPPDGVRLYRILRCRQHGVEFADALPGPKKNALEVGRLTVNYGGDPTQSSPRYIDFMGRLEAVVGPATGRVLHDVGCGMGNLLCEARRRSWRVQGSDVASGVKAGIET